MFEPHIPFIVAVARERQQAYVCAAEQWRRQHVEREPPRQHRPARSVVAQVLIRGRHWLVESGKPAMPAEEVW